MMVLTSLIVSAIKIDINVVNVIEEADVLKINIHISVFESKTSEMALGIAIQEMMNQSECL